MRFAILTALAVLLAIPAPAETIVGKVVGVADGDTITVLVEKKQIKVRLEGIDAPETGQPFGDRAKQALSKAVFGKMVAVEVSDTDRWGRSIGRVFAKVKGKPADVNLALVTAGLAWHYFDFSDDKALAEAEKEAREKRRGLWADKEPVAPWDWRKKKKAEKSKAHAVRMPSPGAS